MLKQDVSRNEFDFNNNIVGDSLLSASASFLAELSVRSPRKLIIFII